jgi:hypothetical protein
MTGMRNVKYLVYEGLKRIWEVIIKIDPKETGSENMN